jgi:glycosyltransferase involved in cell wall biosynthesis
MKHWTSIPNFVDTDLFRPDRDRGLAFRQEHGIPADALVFGCAAAVKKHHKRIDYLIREFTKISHNRTQRDTKINHETHQTHESDASLLYLATNQEPGTRNSELGTKNSEPFLLIAGAKTEQTDELEKLAEELGNGRIKILVNLSREQMPAFYNAANVFVLTSLFEMMPIAVLEALASGLPVIANRHPVLEWMVGPGGFNLDMSCDGELAKFLMQLTDGWIKEKGLCARQHALANFSKDAVIRQYIEYYKEILGQG